MGKECTIRRNQLEKLIWIKRGPLYHNTDRFRHGHRVQVNWFQAHFSPTPKRESSSQKLNQRQWWTYNTSWVIRAGTIATPSKIQEVFFSRKIWNLVKLGENQEKNFFKQNGLESLGTCKKLLVELRISRQVAWNFDERRTTRISREENWSAMFKTPFAMEVGELFAWSVVFETIGSKP